MGREMMTKVMIVETDVSALRVTSWILEEGGFDAVSAHSIDEAVVCAGREQPDVIIVNTGLLPAEKGRGIDRLHERAPAAHVIDLSTYAENKGLAARGAERALLKPYHADELVDMVREMVG